MNLRISIILASLWLSGGEKIIIEIANRLSERKNQINLILPNGTIDSSMENMVIPSVKILQTQNIGAREMKITSKLNLTLELARTVPQSDLILTTYTPTTPAGWVSSRILKRGKLVWFYQDFPEMFVNKPVYRLLANIAPKWHDGIITISQYLKDEIKSHSKKVPIFVIGEALSQLELYQPHSPERRFRFSTGKRSLLYLGDMRPRKGLADFLTASEIIALDHPEIELWIALKDGNEVETRVPHRIINRPSNVELASLYATCDVFVSSSWVEGFGLPPLEAMASGAPVVMTDSGGVKEYAKNEFNCILVSPHSPVELAKAIKRVLEQPELEDKLRRNGPPTAASFNWSTVMERCELALARIMNS